MKLELEITEKLGKVLETAGESTIKTNGGAILITPNISEDYWVFRVKLTDKQSIIGFPKFWTIGIGFAVEDDWNTNLPYSSDAEKIYNHIKCNKKVDGDKTISKANVVAAIKLVQEAATKYKDAWKEL